MHNELVNAWSHLAPANIYSSVLLRAGYTFLQDDGSYNQWMDSLMVQSYLACITTCLLFPGIYPALNAHSEHVALQCLKLDYLGIVLNTTATSVTSTWFSLKEHRNLQLLYTTSSLGFAVTIFFLILRPNADGPTAAF
ncbi:hypothetical protein AOQ84DRAFT_410104 [Glonium stellatum]|uniref:Uncharacterized protein n=1 Tax=Glonium stellatum TaxID=574774 RepID=A0A8E2EYU1_9PEZI|nr:hypothetical protein AOQ84DRAFT_410104 [Glonium stellatum]